MSAFLKELILRYRKDVKKITLSFIFCDDDYLITINHDFLQHDTYTDIITFDLTESKSQLVSDIYISIDRVQENATKYKTDYDRELHRVIFHGVLHLCGFKDKSQQDIRLMREKEEDNLTAYLNKH